MRLSLAGCLFAAAALRGFSAVVALPNGLARPNLGLPLSFDGSSAGTGGFYASSLPRGAGDASSGSGGEKAGTKRAENGFKEGGGAKSSGAVGAGSAGGGRGGAGQERFSAYNLEDPDDRDEFCVAAINGCLNNQPLFGKPLTRKQCIEGATQLFQQIEPIHKWDCRQSWQRSRLSQRKAARQARRLKKEAEAELGKKDPTAAEGRVEGGQQLSPFVRQSMSPSMSPPRLEDFRAGAVAGVGAGALGLVPWLAEKLGRWNVVPGF